MKRRSFLKGLAATAAVPAVAKSAIPEKPDPFGLAPIKAEGSSVNFDTGEVYNVGDKVCFEGQIVTVKEVL